MAINVHTKDVALLIERLAFSLNGSADMPWLSIGSGDYEYIQNQWKGRVLIHRYNITANLQKKHQFITFSVVCCGETPMSQALYATCAGEFTKLLCAHFSDYFDSIDVTATFEDGVDVYQA